MNVYGDGEQARRFKEASEAGKKLDMGKSCVRFRTADDLAPDQPRRGDRRHHAEQ